MCEQKWGGWQQEGNFGAELSAEGLGDLGTVIGLLQLPQSLPAGAVTGSTL